MEKTEDKNTGYQFTPIPLNLMACCDINCRSMLWTMAQLSSNYANEHGWFFRTNDDLRVQSQLSENLVRATISALHRIGIIEVMTVGKGKSKTPNKFKLNTERFNDYEKYSLDDCIKHPDLRIETDNYKGKGWQPSYLIQLDNEAINDTIVMPTSSLTISQSEDNIKNIENKNNIFSECSKQIEMKSNQFEVYKKREDVLMDKLYHVTTWNDFKTFRKQINELLSIATSEKIAEKTKKRYKSIEDGKLRFLKSKISKEPYNSFYEDFYREYDCGWLGKDDRPQINQPQQQSEEDENIVATREILKQYGIDVPNEKERDIADKENITRVPDSSEKKECNDLPF